MLNLTQFISIRSRNIVPPRSMLLASFLFLVLLIAPNCYSQSNQPINGTNPWKTFFVGDLSFALEDYWEEVSSHHKGKNFSKITIRNPQEESFDIYLFTVDGDGKYTSTKNESIVTDSGTIGAVPIDFWGDKYPEEVDSMGIVRALKEENIKLEANTIFFDEIVFENAMD